MTDIQIGTERYFYQMYKDENTFGKEMKYLFCDELDEYIFCLYTKKLSQTKRFKELKKQMDEILIYLPDSTMKGYIGVPCLVVEEQKRIYIMEDVFN